MELFRNNNALEASIHDPQDCCVLVPTMGALHDGHAALIRLGAQLARVRALRRGCVVTIFVNPTQFNDRNDFARYPRTLEEDLVICQQAGASAVFAPMVEDVYPPDAPPGVPPLPDVATAPRLEDAHRPGHFAGVCQVVARLFELTRPAAAIFGEKDWQQLAVIRAMTRTMQAPFDHAPAGASRTDTCRSCVDAPHDAQSRQSRRDDTRPCTPEIIAAPTLREQDGLAMSSRNRFLSPDDRVRASGLFRALCECQAAATPQQAEAIMHRVLREHGIVPEYAVVRDAVSLLPIPPRGARDGSTERAHLTQRGACRALIAARVGSVRLIDNTAW